MSQPSPPSADAPVEESVSLTPTLVILWSRDGEVARDLRASVTRRLRAYSEVGALQWAGPFSPEQEITGKDLARACEPLLSWDLWQRLVEKGYRAGLPAPGSPARIQVILVVDRMRGELDGPPPGLMKEMRKLLKGQADLLPFLIWLGEKPEPPPEDLNLYWPRIRMEPVAAGGIAVAPSLVWEATEHLLVALMSSAFIPVMNRMVQKEKAEWLVTGASALLLHPNVEEWLYKSVMWEILHPLVAPLPETERDRIEEAMGQEAQRVRGALREEVIAALQEVGWEIHAEGPVVRQCVLKNATLLKALLGPYIGGISPYRLKFREWQNWPGYFLTMISALAKPFLPDQDVGETLHQHYLELVERIEQWLGTNKWRGLAPRALEEYRDISIQLGSLLDLGLTFRLPPGTTWWFAEKPLPSGLPATLMALLSLEKHLCEEGDFKDEREGAQGHCQDRVCPEPLNTEGYLQTAGETDAAIVRWDLLRYAHFARTLASPWGVLLYLLPAWPLAAFLVQSIVEWEPLQAALVTGLVLLGIGLAELAYWWLLKARRLLKAVQREAHFYLSSRILRLAAAALRDYRQWMLAQLREADWALTDLYGVCLRQYAEMEKASRALSEKLRPYVKGSTHFLIDAETVQEWKQRVKEAICHYPGWLGEGDEQRIFNSAVTGLIIREVWPLSRRPMPGEQVLSELQKVCEEEIRRQEPLPDRWSASVAAEKTDGLKEGRRWKWLWDHAHPLGKVESPAVEFTFIMAPEEFLIGKSGKESPYWRSDWEMVPSFQNQEEMCVRVYVEPKRGA